MQQTKSLPEYTPSNLSPTFQDWLAKEKSDAHTHRLGIAKMALLVCSVSAVLLFSDPFSVFQDIVALIAGLIQL